MRIQQAALKFRSSRGAAADAEFFSPPHTNILNKTAEVEESGAQKAGTGSTYLDGLGGLAFDLVRYGGGLVHLGTHSHAHTPPM